MDTPNLYESGGYYVWRHPKTGKRYGVGKDRADAIAQAKEANAALAAPATLTERAATPERSLAGFLTTYRQQIESADLATITRYNRGRHIAAIGAALGDLEIAPSLDAGAEATRRTSIFLMTYVTAGKRRMAKAMRATLIDLYAAMCSAGWLTINPAMLVKLPAPKVKRERLTLDTFRRIYGAAADLDPWVRRSMALALVTLQRREDVAAMTFRHVVDERLRVEQHKTGARLRIPLELRLECVGWSVGDAVAQCRDAVLSRSLIHHTKHQGRAKPGDAVHPQTLTTAFAEARARAGIITEEGKTAPSFHELRSLGARLYKQQGYDPQALLGHKQASTTATYLDDRGAEWIDVAA